MLYSWLFCFIKDQNTIFEFRPHKQKYRRLKCFTPTNHKNHCPDFFQIRYLHVKLTSLVLFFEI